MTRSADTIRTELAAAMATPAPRTRRVRDRIDELTWELDRATATGAINARRAVMGLVAW